MDSRAHKAKNITIAVDHYKLGEIKIIKVSDEVWQFFRETVERGAREKGQTIKWEYYER